MRYVILLFLLTCSLYGAPQQLVSPVIDSGISIYLEGGYNFRGYTFYNGSKILDTSKGCFGSLGTGTLSLGVGSVMLSSTVFPGFCDFMVKVNLIDEAASTFFHNTSLAISAEGGGVVSDRLHEKGSLIPLYSVSFGVSLATRAIRSHTTIELIANPQLTTRRYLVKTADFGDRNEHTDDGRSELINDVTIPVGARLLFHHRTTPYIQGSIGWSIPFEGFQLEESSNSFILENYYPYIAIGGGWIFGTRDSRILHAFRTLRYQK